MAFTASLFATLLILFFAGLTKSTLGLETFRDFRVAATVESLGKLDRILKRGESNGDKDLQYFYQSFVGLW